MSTASRPALRLALCVLAPVLLALTGCMDITGRGPAPLERTLDHKIVNHPRVGHVYCMRGWLGIFSTGMDELARRIDEEAGVPGVSVANEEWRRLSEFIIEQKKKGNLNEPLVLLGHSYGADDQIRIAQNLKDHNIAVDLLVLLDPVTPPDVPTNVKRVFCMYYSHPLTDWYPAWRGVPATVADPNVTPLVNIDLRVTDVGFDTANVHHVNVEKLDGVHRLAIDEIKKVCPPRGQHLAHQPAPMFDPRGKVVVPTTQDSRRPAATQSAKPAVTGREPATPARPAGARAPAVRPVVPALAAPRVGPNDPEAAAVRPE